MMDRDTVDLVLRFLGTHAIRNLDVTGGAPELNPHFRYLVTEARAAGVAVIDRCNLTVLEQPGQDDLAEFLAEQDVRIVASLPCYTRENVDRQRGKGVYESSLRGLRQLNRAGFAEANTGLVLDLVYNPVGPFLPPDPEALESDYKCEFARLGVIFNRLLTITNMPINRFRYDLLRSGELNNYMSTLFDAYMPTNLEHVMCRSLLSVDWRGYVYDCDFNQMLELPLAADAPTHLNDLLDVSLSGRGIAVGTHCFGCTAGRGSSCTGALSA